MSFNSIGVEKGFLFVISFCKSLGINYYAFTVIHSLSFMIGMYLLLKKYNKNFSFFIIIFIYKLYIYNTFISLRQPFALLIFWYSIKYLDKNMIKYFICCLVATLFHISSLVLFPIYFLYKAKKNKKILTIIGCICFIVFLLSITGIYRLDLFDIISKIFTNNPRMMEKVKIYFSSNSGSLNIFHTLEFYALFIPYMLNYNKIEKNTNSAVFNFNNTCIVVLMLIFTFFRGFEIITRLKDFFIIVYPVMICSIIDVTDKNKNKLLIIILSIIISLFGYYRFLRNFDGGGFIPYQSFIFK